jgi:hypothetical protein
MGRKNSSQNYHTPSQIANIKNLSPKTFKLKAKLKITKGPRTTTFITDALE